MQGFAFKVTIVTVALFSVAFVNSPAFAVSRMSSAINHQVSSNKTEMLNSGAGCMGCHQGETIAMASDELSEVSQDNQDHNEQKQHTSQEPSK